VKFAIHMPGFSTASVRPRRALLVTAIAGSLANIGACDPCFGIGNCDGQPRLAVEGTLVEHVVGNAVSGVRVDLIRTGGEELENDSLSTVTDPNGHWSLAVGARAGGDVTVDIKVSAPGYSPYRVVGTHVETTDLRGAGHIFPAWVVNPYFAYAAELHYRTPEDVRIGGASVEFRRTGGIDYYMDAIDQIFAGQTDASGRLALFDIKVHAIGLGDLVGDLIVHLPAPLKPDTIHGLRLAATQLFQAPTTIITIGAGPPQSTVTSATIAQPSAGSTVATKPPN
jgi:hypothetical protein